MKKIILNITDEQAKVLEKYPNRSEIIRNAIDVYIQHISTDTINGLRQSYKNIMGKLESYDYEFERIDKLIDFIESRMM